MSDAMYWLWQDRMTPAGVYALPSEGLRGVPKKVILYQYDVCPFCCKVKAVLDYYRVSLHLSYCNASMCSMEIKRGA